MEIQATIPVQYNKPNIEYQQTIVKVNKGCQTTHVYTYDKHGHLVQTVVRNHEIAEV